MFESHRYVRHRLDATLVLFWRTVHRWPLKPNRNALIQCCWTERAIKPYNWWGSEDIFLIASHIPGQNYLLADYLSRRKCLPSESTLCLVVFKQLIRIFGIDLYTRLLNSHLPLFCSWVQESEEFALNAFAIQWRKWGELLRSCWFLRFTGELKRIWWRWFWYLDVGFQTSWNVWCGFRRVRIWCLSPYWEY